MQCAKSPSSVSPRYTHHSHGTFTDVTSTARRSDDDVICAIIDNRSGDVGVASCSLQRLRVTLSQYSDSASSFSKTIIHMEAMNPASILLPSTALEGKLSLSLVRALAGTTTFVSVDRKLFNETRGASRLQQLMSTDAALIEVSSTERYLCVAAAHALLQYVEQTQQCSLVPRTVDVRFVGLSRYVEIDRSTLWALQLFDSSRSQGRFAAQCGKAPTSLVDVVDKTITPMGRRLLRANLLQPCRDLPTLQLRLDTVEAMLSHQHVLTAVRGALRTFADLDVDKIIGTFSLQPREKTLRTVQHIVQCVLLLRRALIGSKSVVTALRGSAEPPEPLSVLIDSVVSSLSHEAFAPLAEEVSKCVDEEVADLSSKNIGSDHSARGAHAKAPRATQLLQQCFAVRSNVSGVLDLARKRFSDLLEEMYSIADSLREKFSIPSLKLGFDATRGHYLVYDTAHDGLADGAVFVQKARQGNRHTTCTTSKLAVLNSACRDSVVEILQSQDAVLEKLVSFIRSQIAALQALSDGVAMLDMATAMTAFAGSRESCARPTFTSCTAQDNGTHVGRLRLVQSRHPVMSAAYRQRFRSNDVRLEGLTILTGANAAGKTTLLRQVGQSVLLAHVGCFVPAAEAVVPLVDRIVARMTCDDAPDAGISTFMEEMMQASYMVSRVTSQSLVLIDELGRSTSTSEGAAIAWAMAEWLADVGCLTLFVTHFTQLPRLASQLPHAVANKHLSVKVLQHTDAGGQHPLSILQFLYSLEDGPCDTDAYGLRTAAAVGLADNVLALAEQYAERLRQPWSNCPPHTDPTLTTQCSPALQHD